MVGEFCRSHGAQATIVFDGPAPAGTQAQRSGHRTRVLFGEGRAADDLILRFLADAKAPRDFTVVTSDKSLGDKSRHRGALVEKAHEFSRRLDRAAPKEAGPREKDTPRESPEEIDAWLAVFDPSRK